MSRKHAELERELIEDLEPRTGRSLAGWMAAIDAADLADKNAIIDWLRPQGLTFAHASWLERIHNNGGRPIYIGGPASSDALPPTAELPVAPLLQRPLSAPAAPRPAVPALSLPAGAPLDALLARGKGLRPLAEMLLREIRQAMPSVTIAAVGDLVSFTNPAELAVLSISPRELRLGLTLGDAGDGPLAKGRPPGADLAITHTVTLSDARQIGPELLTHVLRADAQTNKAHE